MGFKLEDGTGGGTSAKVDSTNHLATTSVSIPSAQHINQTTEQIWSIPFEDLNPAGNDDYVIYIKNTGDLVLQIADVRIAGTAAGQVEVHAVSGTAAGGTAITPVPKTIGSSVIPTATIESGTDITGLTNDGIMYFIQCPVADTESHLLVENKIRIPKGKAVAILVENGSANYTGIITLVAEEDIT